MTEQTTVDMHPRLRTALLRYFRGEGPLVMAEVAPLPVRLPDGRVVAFGELTPDELEAHAAAMLTQARRDYEAIVSEWGDGR